MYHFTDLFSAAKSYSSLGFFLFPCHSIETNGNCTCGKADCDKNKGKHPLTAQGCKDATNDPAKLKEYFTGDYSVANIAVATGELSGVVVLDADNLHDLNSLESTHGKLPTTWTVKTGSGGRHFYFRFDKRCTRLKNAVKFAGALDVRTTGGYTLLPPSKHKSGNAYRWIVAPNACEIATLPDWLFDLMPKHDDAAVGRAASNGKAPTLTIQRATTLAERAAIYLEKAEPAIEGQRGEFKAFNVACRLRELFGELSDDELYAAFGKWNEKNIPPFSPKELRHKFDDAAKKVSSSSTTIVRYADDGCVNEAVEIPTLDDDAYHGLAGDIVKAIEPETEADPVGVLLTVLTAFGHAFGRIPFFRVSGDIHHANLFTCLVGDSASGKGLAWGIGRHCVPNEYLETSHGLSSGEGLVERVGDPADMDALAIPPSKPLLCVETEFAKPITAMRREGNTLSPLLRSAWDCSTLEIMTRGKSKLRASNAYISIVAHITPEELRAILVKGVEIYNGFANRFLWTLVRSSKSLPTGGNIDVLDSFSQRIKQVIETARTIGEMKRTTAAEKLWAESYSALKESKPGAFGKAVERGRPYVVRLSMIYALLDSTPNIDVRHLQAALAVWRYCEDSARILFGHGDENKLESRLLEIVQNQPGVMRSELRSAISHSITTSVFDHALNSLVRRGKIVSVPTFGNRQAECYYAGVGIRDLAGYRHTAPVAVEAAKSAISQYPKPTHDVDVHRGFAAMNGANGMGVTMNVTPATLGELFDWRNFNSVAFCRREDGLIWVVNMNNDEISHPIAAAIHANQDTLAAFVAEPTPTPPITTSSTLTIQDEHDWEKDEFYQQIVNLDKEPQSKPLPEPIEGEDFFDGLRRALKDIPVPSNSPQPNCHIRDDGTFEWLNVTKT
jgi:hypothetical protein